MSPGRIVSSFLLLAIAGGAAMAILPPQYDTPVAERIYQHPNYYIRTSAETIDVLPADLAQDLSAGLATLGVKPEHAWFDRRSGVWMTLMDAGPLVPGPGLGNSLSWDALGLVGEPDDVAYETAVRDAFLGYLTRYRQQLGIDPEQLGRARIAPKENRRVTHVYMPREINGVPVRDSYVVAVVNSGNMVLYGTKNFGPMDVDTTPSLSKEAARSALRAHLAPHVPDRDGVFGLSILPLGKSLDVGATPTGEGLSHRLVYDLKVGFKGDNSGWEGLVDAHTGEVLRFHDTNHYFTRRFQGGILPVSNDGIAPDGIEVADFPMPFMNVTIDGNIVTTNDNGLLSVLGDGTATDLFGPFVNMNDSCTGVFNESTVDSCGGLNLGVGADTDCAPPAGHSADDTRASRSGFYELNRIIQNAKIFRPNQTWLFGQLQSNMNINNSCNAFWNGTVNFYTSGVHPTNSTIVCRNTGEEAAVFDHEWGHGIDANDNIPVVSLAGEAYADIAAIARLNDACVGRGFFLSSPNGGFCTMFGDPCTDCSGVRVADWKRRASGLPHDIAWIANASVNPGIPGVAPPGGCSDSGPGTAPCGGSVHCEGSVITEAFWDFMTRELPCIGIGWDSSLGANDGVDGSCAAGTLPQIIDRPTALEILTRMFYIAGDGVEASFTCTPTPGQAGCNATAWYFNLIAADDDNGNLGDGTPHIEPLYAAFLRHTMDCAAPAPVDLGTNCPDRPDFQMGTGPAATATALVQGAKIDWTAVPDATSYLVLRGEGVHQCDFGKLRVAEVSSTSPLTFTDTGLLDGIEYYYQVIPVGSSGAIPGACHGAASNCAAVMPLADVVAGPGLAVALNPAPLTITGGDPDPFVDNCETARLTVDILNVGDTQFDNVRITDVTAIAPAGNTVTWLNGPSLNVTPGSLVPGCTAGTGTADVEILARDLPSGAGATMLIEIEVTGTPVGARGGAPLTFVGTIAIEDTESSFVTVPTRTWSFDSDLEDWTVASGSWVHNSTPAAGANASTGYLESPDAVDNACDKLRSPEVRLTASSTLSLFNQFVTEPEGTGMGVSTFYDRANVGLVNPLTASRVGEIHPSGGRMYNAFTAGGTTYSGCNEPEEGWATGIGNPDASTWGASSWDSTALEAGDWLDQPIIIEIINARDGVASARGTWIDEITLTDYLGTGADAQPDDTCIIPPDPGYCATLGLPPLFLDNFNTGDVTPLLWSFVRNPDGELTGAGPGLGGTANGLQVAIDHNPPGSEAHESYTLDRTPEGIDTYCAEFLFDPNTGTLARRTKVYATRGDDNVRLMRAMVRENPLGGGGASEGGVEPYQIRYSAQNDNNKWVNLPWVDMPDAETRVSLFWQQGDGSQNGSFTLYLDGVEVATRINFNNDDRGLGAQAIGNLGLFKPGTDATMYWDEFVSFGVDVLP